MRHNRYGKGGNDTLLLHDFPFVTNQKIKQPVNSFFLASTSVIRTSISFSMKFISFFNAGFTITDWIGDRRGVFQQFSCDFWVEPRWDYWLVRALLNFMLIQIYKGKVRRIRHTHGFIHVDISRCTYFSDFVITFSCIMNSCTRCSTVGTFVFWPLFFW